MTLKCTIRRLDPLTFTIQRVSQTDIAEPYLHASAAEVNLDAQGNAQSIDIQSNTDWTIT